MKQRVFLIAATLFLLVGAGSRAVEGPGPCERLDQEYAEARQAITASDLPEWVVAEDEALLEQVYAIQQTERGCFPPGEG